jgi:hypothetical protein
MRQVAIICTRLNAQPAQAGLNLATTVFSVEYMECGGKRSATPL